MLTRYIFSVRSGGGDAKGALCANPYVVTAAAAAQCLRDHMTITSTSTATVATATAGPMDNSCCGEDDGGFRHVAGPPSHMRTLALGGGAEARPRSGGRTVTREEEAVVSAAATVLAAQSRRREVDQEVP